MRRFLLLFAISMVPPASLAQSVPYLTVTDNGSTIILAGNFNGDGGGDIVSEDSNGNLDCVPSDGGKYDLGIVVSPVHFPGSPEYVATATATLQSGASDYIILGGDGIANVYSSSNCIFTFSQSLIIEGTATDVFVTPPSGGGSGGVYVTVVSAVAGQSAFTFYSQIFQNSNGTLSPGPPGLGPGAEGFAAGSSIAIANFVEPQPPGPLSTLSVSLWTFASGAWTSTPSFTPPGIPEGFVTAPKTQALYLVSHDDSNIYVQQVDPSSGAAGAPVSYEVGSEAFGMAAFNGDSFAIPFADSVQIFQDSTGNGAWTTLGSLITVAITPVPPDTSPLDYGSFVGSGVGVPGGFALQSNNGRAVVFTVQNGAVASAPSSLAFPSTEPGSSSSSPLTVTNSGNASLNVTDVVFSGANAADFSQTNNCTAVAPAVNCTVTVVFRPSTFLAESATMAINSNASNSPTNVSLAAAAAPAPIISVSSTSLDFGTVAVNSTATKTLVIGNSGSAPLNDFSVQVSGAVFALANNPCPISLAVLAQCTITVSFSPTAAVSGTVLI